MFLSSNIPADLHSAVIIGSNRTITETGTGLNTDPFITLLPYSTIRYLRTEWLALALDAETLIAWIVAGAGW
jgi:hypothetical protein